MQNRKLISRIYNKFHILYQDYIDSNFLVGLEFSSKSKFRNLYINTKINPVRYSIEKRYRNEKY